MTVFTDLSVRTGPTPSEATPVEIETLGHEQAPSVFGLTNEDFPDGIGISNESVTLTTHTGTHMDAPLHYGPTSNGEPAKSIDQVPLEWCVGPGVRLDLRHIPPGEAITTQALREALEHISHVIAENDIVLIWTGADKLWGTAEYLTEYPGLSGEATQFLVEQGVRVIGIDAWGLDRPVTSMLTEYANSKDPSALWPSHVYGRTREYLQLEKLANLGNIPAPSGFTVICFPVAVSGAGAGWTRVVAASGDSVFPPAIEPK
ncbi:cyclase family protein [Dietzia timorensis]|uniref:cyclase family protein n=1 Tax=Dietzia timorensis TaxID=499555 RepID=UPI0009ECE9C0|nr:cyclase family protein [Dietzia timorensis]